MKTHLVEVRRVYGMGPYENLRLGEVVEIEEGEDATEVRAALVATFNTEVAAIREAEQAVYRAEHPVLERFQVTPEMVKDAPDLLTKALFAHDIKETRESTQVIDLAEKRAWEWFGLTASFELGEDGKAFVTLPDAKGELDLIWQGSSSSFTVDARLVDEMGPYLVKMTYIGSLEDLGKKLDACNQVRRTTLAAHANGEAMPAGDPDPEASVYVHIGDDSDDDDEEGDPEERYNVEDVIF